MSKRIRTGKLQRLDPAKNFGNHFFYSPDGYCSRAYETAEAMEAAIKEYYEEVDANEQETSLRTQ